MEWHHWMTLWKLACNSQGFRGDEEAFLTLNRHLHPDYHYVARLAAECQWGRMRRPYYRLYPGVIDAFLHTPLDLPRRLLSPPMDGTTRLTAMTILLPKGNGIAKSDNGAELTGILFSFGGPGHLWMWWDYEDAFVYQFGHFPLESDATIEEELESRLVRGLGVGPEWLNTHYSEVLRLVVATILVPLHDEDLVRPEVLARDKEQWKQTHDAKLIERARRNHRYGFVIGEQMEEAIAADRRMSPHYRRPHLVLQPHGPHHLLRRLQWRKGSWVKREVIEKRPTGYEDEQEQPKSGKPSCCLAGAALREDWR